MQQADISSRMAEYGQLHSETRAHEDVTRIRAEVDKLHLHHFLRQSRPSTADRSAPTVHLADQCQLLVRNCNNELTNSSDEVYHPLLRSYGDPVSRRRILRGRLLPTRAFHDI